MAAKKKLTCISCQVFYLLCLITVSGKRVLGTNYQPQDTPVRLSVSCELWWRKQAYCTSFRHYYLSHESLQLHTYIAPKRYVKVENIEKFCTLAQLEKEKYMTHITVYVQVSHQVYLSPHTCNGDSAIQCDTEEETGLWVPWITTPWTIRILKHEIIPGSTVITFTLKNKQP